MAEKFWNKRFWCWKVRFLHLRFLPAEINDSRDLFILNFGHGCVQIQVQGLVFPMEGGWTPPKKEKMPLRRCETAQRVQRHPLGCLSSCWCFSILEIRGMSGIGEILSTMRWFLERSLDSSSDRINSYWTTLPKKKRKTKPCHQLPCYSKHFKKKPKEELILTHCEATCLLTS